LSNIGQLKAYLTPRYKRPTTTYLQDHVAKLFFGHRKLVTDALDLQRFLKREGPFDLLWAQCEEPDSLVAAFAAKLGKIPPLFSQVYALRYQFNADNSVRFTRRRSLRFALHPAKAVIANSPMVARDLEHFYGINRNQIHVLPHNLTNAFLQRWAQRDLRHQQQEKKRVLFFGALNEKKGALCFLKAACRLAGQDPNIQFAVAGGFTEKNPAFERAWNTHVAESGLGPRLELLGHLKMETVQKEILKANVVVLPSVYDEFSRAVVEVLALGRPVVTTQFVGAEYLVKKYRSGMIVTPGDSAMLAWAIRRVLRYPAYGQNALCHAFDIREAHSAEKLAKQLVELWQKNL
jgi:glycosyltransferase involved in cell wall biosynthesis